ncbi:ParA family protein [Mycoplasma sp. P36-A1]|uniref:ParA family protein n=1 Tax=Mycoplasma sp. P36-A1 TaxID=3252900 RepID=UPI003C2E6816
MAKIMAVTNQKGGVGKTTTSVNLASALGHMEYKVLLVDLDPQGNSTSALGIDKPTVEKSVYDVIMHQCEAEEALVQTKFVNLIIMPASIDLAGVDLQLASVTNGREKMLQTQLEKLRPFFDFIIIDCPPSLGVLNTNALTAADSVMIPVQSEFFALEGLTQLLMTIRLVQKNFNHNLKIEGVLLTMYDKRNNLSMEVAKEVRKYFKNKVYETVVNRNVKLSEAPGSGMPISEYAPNSPGSRDYESLAKEVSEANGKK